MSVEIQDSSQQQPIDQQQPDFSSESRPNDSKSIFGNLRKVSGKAVSLISGNPRSTTNQQGKSASKHTSRLKLAFTAIAATAAAIGVLGLLVYLGKLNVGWQGIGNISQQMSLYGTLGGLGTATIITILLTVTWCMNGKANDKTNLNYGGKKEKEV